MARPNKTFELSVADMDLIETALRSQKKSLSNQLVETQLADEDARDAVQNIQDLLGRLHNQKEFFRPRSGAYVGG